MGANDCSARRRASLSLMRSRRSVHRRFFKPCKRGDSMGLVKHDDCGGRMRGKSASAARRFCCSCNLLPNSGRPVVSERVVLRLVVSVENSWGNLRRLGAQTGRFARAALSWWKLLPRTAANRTCLSQRLDNVIVYWGTPAPAAQSSRVVDTPMQPTAASALHGWNRNRSTPFFDVGRLW